MPLISSLDRADIAPLLERVSDLARRRRQEGKHDPTDTIDQVRGARLGALRLPPELGGAGFTVRELLAFVIDLAAADPDAAHALRSHYWFVEELLRSADSAGSSTAPWLELTAQGRIIGAAVAELSTQAVGNSTYDTTLSLADGSLRLNGTKFYATGSKFSDVVRTSARDESGDVVTVIVPADRDGVVFDDDWDGIGQRGTATGTTRFVDVVVEPDELYRPLKAVAERETRLSSFAQLYLHAVAAGILRELAHDTAATLRNRTRGFAWGNAAEPRHDPQLLEIAGRVSSAAFAAESVVLSAAATFDPAAQAVIEHGTVDPQLEEASALASSQAKVAIEEFALKAAGEIFDVAGASAVREREHLHRHWLNLRTLFSHNPTAFKARSIGDLAVNGTALPRNGYF